MAQTLAAKFKTNAVAAVEGVWFDFPAFPNPDGTIPGFKLARRSPQNREYQKMLLDTGQLIAEANEGGGDSEAIAEQREIATFIDTILIDWRNFYPTETQCLEYSETNAVKIFEQADWNDLLQDLMRKAIIADNYKIELREEEVKNS